ncbi:TPA: hypothetical protein ACU8BJ_001921 [Neisseria subflava]
MALLSYQLVIFNKKFCSLGMDDEKNMSFIKKFFDLNFIPQSTQEVNVEFNGNHFQQKVIDIVDLRSNDKRWSIEFRPNQISISYNHAYPDDHFSPTEFKDKLSIFFPIIEGRFSFSACNRIGFVRKKTEDDLSSFLADSEIEESKIIEKSQHIASKEFMPSIDEEVNHMKIKTFSQNAEIQTIDKLPIPFEGLYIFDDINTLASNLSPRFDQNHILAFVESIFGILSE